AIPVRLVHDGVAGGAYAGARALTGAVVRAGAGAISLSRGDDVRSLSQHPSGAVALAVLNGLWGDTLLRDASSLATTMAVRCHRRDVALDPESLRAAYPDATRRLVVFVHGLCETEDAWRAHSDRSRPYGDRLASELHYTPVYIRYNSGLHVSDNGRRLALILDALTRCWPVDVAEVSLVGHSMGGLVIRSACHYAATHRWRERVRHVFMLGAPHRGAPLERAVNAAGHAASLLPETRPFAAPIRIRSAGIKDLRYGYVVDEDWGGHDPDAFRDNTATVVPYLETASHYFVSATLARDPDDPLGRLVGDLLVLHRSAWSQAQRHERLQFPVGQYRHLGGANHFDLLNHPAVYAQIEGWLRADQRP
ncbi:MAG: hypothetical protein WAL63_19830, partial [Solirubrobacteraceae bacterium]